MASAAAANDGPSDTECSICHEFFTEPKLLPCAHLLCRSCLVTWMKKETNAVCPLCRGEIVNPKQKASHTPEDIANTFPTDYSMVALVDATRLLLQPHVCKVCEDVSASSLCLDCGDMLCCKCGIAHRKLSATRDHSLEDLSSLTAGQLARKRPVACIGHPNRPSEFYCHMHDAYLCFFCAKKLHHACENIKSVEELKEEKRKTALTLMATMSSEENRLTQAINMLDANLAELNAFEASAESKIKKLRESLLQSVAECCNHLEEKVADASAEKKTKVADDKNLLVQARSKLTTQKAQLQHVQESLSANNLMGATLALTNISDDFNKHDERIIPKSMTMSNLNFTVSQEGMHKIAEGLKILCTGGEDQAFWEPLQGHENPSVSEETNTDVPCFHTRHGRNINLISDMQVARRTHGEGGGIIFGSSPMVLNKLYEVCIDEVDDGYRRHTIYFGVSMKAPEHVTIPEWSGDLEHGSSIILSPGWVRLPDGQYVHIDQFSSALSGVGTGHRVGLDLIWMPENISLHLYVDGKCQGTIAKLDQNVPECYAMFDLMAYWKQVTMQPLKDI